MQHCPKCSSDQVVKNGIHLNKQRFRCKKCGFQFTRKTPRGRPVTEKTTAILLYTLGLSFNSIARIYGVASSTVMRWVRDAAGKPYEATQLGEAIVIEPDELSSFLHNSKKNLGQGRAIVILPTSSLTEDVVIVTRTHQDDD